MRNRFDHAAKQIGQGALAASGTTVANEEIHAETQYADLHHEPDPTRQVERDRLGLLGRMASYPCLLETYSQAPDADEIRACLAKHLAFWQRRMRGARAANRKRRSSGDPAAPRSAPFLWVIAARPPTKLLMEIKPESRPEWPAGVYFFGGELLRMGIVVASDLPRDNTTLLVRLMAGGPLLAGAVKEVAALQPTAYERIVAEPILLSLQSVLGQEPSHTPDEEEFIVAMLKTWEEGRTEARMEGRAEGQAEGRAEARANDVLTVLRARGVAVSDAARNRILAQRDLQQLDQWLEKAAIASSISEVIGEPG